MNSFVKDPSSIMSKHGLEATFYDAEILTAYWETAPEIIAHVLPPPLKPAKRPLVSAFIANYPRTNFGLPYYEAALLVYAEFNGQPGNYCIAISVDNDMAMAMGREIHGFPKKMGKMELKKDGALVTGSLSRLGIEFFSIKAMLNGITNVEDGKKVIEEVFAAPPPIFNFKYSHATDGSGYDLKPRLSEQQEAFDKTVTIYGEAEVKLQDSAQDPWAELEVVTLLGATYATSASVVLKQGKVLTDVDPVAYIPFSRNKWDR